MTTKAKQELEALCRMFDPFYQEKIKASIEEKKFEIFEKIIKNDEKRRLEEKKELIEIFNAIEESVK